MKKIILMLFVLMPSFTMAQDWLPMLRKVFACAPAWDKDGGYSIEEAGYQPNTFCYAGGFYSGGDGYFRVGYDDLHTMQIYYNSKRDFLPGTMFYVGEAEGCWEPTGSGRCYSSNGKLLYEGKFGDWQNTEVAQGHPVGTYPTPYVSNKRFQAIWDGPNMYLGETVNGVRHGWGLYIWSNGDCLFGEWKNGQKVGFGLKKYSNTCACISSENWKETVNME